MDGVSVVLLAGGKGTRLKSSIPKQFLSLRGKMVALYSLEIFLSLPEVKEVIVVCENAFFSLFSGYPVKQALPGERRQDSLYNGLQACDPMFPWVCVHDAARPLISREACQRLFEDGKKIGAASLGMPVKWTVKECMNDKTVNRTLDRSLIWEIQTPQFLSRNILENGFSHANQHQLTVTDDVSLAELLGHPVKMVEGSYANLKITTPEDLVIAESLLGQFT